MKSNSRKRLLLIFLCLWIGSLLIWGSFMVGSRSLFRSYFLRQPEAYRFRAEALIKSKDYQKAATLVRQTTTANPYDFDAHYLLANILYKSGDKAGAYAEMGRLEEVSHGALFRRILVIGYDPGKIYYQMALWDFEAGRVEQGVNHLLRVADEAPIYIDKAPAGFLNIRKYLAERIKSARSNEDMIQYCRLLDAIGEQVRARQILGQIAQEDPRNASAARLTEAELNLLATWFTPDDGVLRTFALTAKKQIDSVLVSDRDYLSQLWGTLLIGEDKVPAQPLPDTKLDPLIGAKPLTVLKPLNLEFVSSVPLKNKPVLEAISFNMYGPGSARATFKLSAPARSLWILARGTTAMRVWPYVIIRLDGREIARRYLRQFAYRPYIIPAPVAAGSHTVEIEYLNDEYEKRHATDTNVYLRALLWMP